MVLMCSDQVSQCKWEGRSGYEKKLDSWTILWFSLNLLLGQLK